MQVIHLSRNEIEEQTGERFTGETGLWLAVLLTLLQSLSNQRDPDHDQAVRIIHDQDGCFRMIAAVLNISTEDLQRRVIRHLRKKQITITGSS